MLGIEKLKELLSAGLEFGQHVAKNLEDGKISIWEGIGLVPDVFKVIGAVKTWPEIKQEIADLTEAEMEELETFVMNKFNIPNVKVKDFVQHTISVVISIVALVNEWKQIKQPAAAEVTPPPPPVE